MPLLKNSERSSVLPERSVPISFPAADPHLPAALLNLVCLRTAENQGGGSVLPAHRWTFQGWRTERRGWVSRTCVSLYFPEPFKVDEQEARCSDGVGGRHRSCSVPYLDLIKQLIFRSLACSSPKSKEDGNSSAECEK